MAQIKRGDTFVDGQQVTGDRLNNHINNASLDDDAIIGQTTLPANTVAVGDSFLIHDLSATSPPTKLRKITATGFLNSPLTCSFNLAGQALKDITLAPNAGTIVTLKTISPTTVGEITTVKIVSAGHGLVAGQVITVTAGPTDFNGTWEISSVTPDELNYVLFAKSIQGAGTCSYVKAPSVLSASNISITGGLYSDGINKFNGATQCMGNLVTESALTAKGVCNFTGTVQFKGTPIFGLYSKVTTPLTTVTLLGTDSVYRFAAWSNNWMNFGKVTYTEDFVVPDEETWEVHLVSSLYNNIAPGAGNYGYGCQLISSVNNVTTTTTVGDTFSIGIARYTTTPYIYNIILPAGTHTIRTVACHFAGGNVGGSELNCNTTTSPSHKTVSKFKTA
jgi:hypothetical protein